MEGIAHRSGLVVGTVLDVLAAAERRVSCAATGGIASVETESSTDSDATAASSASSAASKGSRAGSTGSAASGKSSPRTEKPKPAAGAGLAPPDQGADQGGSGTESETDHERSSGADDSESGSEEDSDRFEDRSSYEREHGLHRSSTPDFSLGLSPVHVARGEYHRGDIICIGGNVNIEGEVRGEVVVVGGVLSISGTVHEGIVAVGSRVFLGDGARIHRDFISVAGPVTRSRDVRIGGEYNSIDVPNLGAFATGHGIFLYLMSLFLLFALILTALRFLAVLVVAAVAPARIERALAAPRPSWVLAFLLGFAVHLFAGLLGFVLIAACVTSPIGVALWLAVRVAVWMGLASIYLEIGRNLSKAAFKNQLSYFGSILLGFAIFAIVGIIPIVGWFITGILSCVALGLMLLTRFGSVKRRALAQGTPIPATSVVSGLPASGGSLPPAAPAPGSAR
jgi:hypothetical protein